MLGCGVKPPAYSVAEVSLRGCVPSLPSSTPRSPLPTTEHGHFYHVDLQSSEIMSSSTGDLEKGESVKPDVNTTTTSTIHPQTTTAQRNGTKAVSSHPTGIASDKERYRVSEYDNNNLRAFRSLIGIQSAATLADTSLLGRVAPNVGLYERVVRSQTKAGVSYKFWAVLIDVCLGLQIVIAAGLTALGAASGNHDAVTVLGVVNTIIAGFLTYLKGLSLPSRMQYFHNEWTKIREYIEQRERDFGTQGCKLSVEEEVSIIQRIFEEVIADIEANTPDRFVSLGSQKGQKGVRPNPPIAKPFPPQSSAHQDPSSKSGSSTATTTTASPPGSDPSTT